MQIKDTDMPVHKLRVEFEKDDSARIVAPDNGLQVTKTGNCSGFAVWACEVPLWSYGSSVYYLNGDPESPADPCFGVSLDDGSNVYLSVDQAKAVAEAVARELGAVEA